MLMPSIFGENLFDDFFNDTKKQDTSTVLRTDIYEKDGYYQICMEVCGIQKENIQIEKPFRWIKKSNCCRYIVTTSGYSAVVIVWFYSEHLEVLFYLLLCSICNITLVASKVKR